MIQKLFLYNITLTYFINSQKEIYYRTNRRESKGEINLLFLIKSNNIYLFFHCVQLYILLSKTNLNKYV